MSTAHMPIQPGTRLQIRLAEFLVGLKAGEAGEVWALSTDDGVAITPQTVNILRIARTGASGVVAAGTRSIASSAAIEFASTGDADPTTTAPQPDEDCMYTVIAPIGTLVEFLGRDEQVIKTTTVS